MPCETQMREVAEQKKRDAQMKALEVALKTKAAKIMKVGNRISIEGWQARGGWCDECAVRKLKQSTDFQVRTLVTQALAGSTALTFGHSH